MKNILVTGGAGYIGSHTVVELAAAGYRPVIVDNFSNSDKSVLDGLGKILGARPTFYEHDYQDQDFLGEVFKKDKINGVIHFAALKAVGESVQQPLRYYQNNVVGLIQLLAAMQKAKIRQLVFSSSCTVYGEADKLPLTETAPIKPAVSPYGATKQIGETIIKDVTVASDCLASLSLRYFNPIGAHPSAEIGELPRGVPANLVPFVTQAAAGLRDKLSVFGADYPTPDGTNLRDYIHVVDLAKAHVKALAFLADQRTGFYDVFNIGTGRGSSVLEVIKTFESATAQKVPYQMAGRRTGDVIAAYADASKAKRILNWRAEKTLAGALTDAWRWQQRLGSKGV